MSVNFLEWKWFGDKKNNRQDLKDLHRVWIWVMTDCGNCGLCVELKAFLMRFGLGFGDGGESAADFWLLSW